MTLGRMLQRRDSAANWATNNPLLADGELVVDETNGFIVRGDGVNNYLDIPITNYYTPYSFILSKLQNNLIPTGVKTANYTADVNDLVICDVTGGTFAITLPSAPPDGSLVGIKNNVAGTLTINRGGTDVFNVSGGATSQTSAMQNQVQIFEYYSGIWYLIDMAIPLGQMDNRYGVHFNNIPWAPEMVCTSNAIPVADGYNDMPGGIAVEPGISAGGIILDSVWLRVGDLSTTNSGGDLVCDIYVGTKNTQGSVAISLTLTNGSQDVIGTLGTALSVAANAVVRAYFTKGSSTVAKPLHVQLRGRYAG